MSQLDTVAADTGISSEEFRSRREGVARDALDRGFAGLVVFSRGGTTVDFYGDVMYLANFHSLFPVIPDSPTWAARGHAALIVPVDGPSVLVTDYLDDPDDRIEVSDIRVAPQVPRTVGRVLRELDLDGRPLGLVGGESMTLRWFDQIEDSVGHKLDVSPADDILVRRRAVKSESELARVRESAAVGVGWMNTTMNAIAEGRTDGEVVGEGLRYLATHGGVQADVALAAGADSLHFFGSSGVPHWNSKHVMQDGEMVHLDQWGPVNNYFTDFGRSTVVGGNPTGEQRELLEASTLLVEHLADAARPGTTCDDLYRRGERWMVDNGFDDAPLGLFGHSLGLTQESPWIVPGEMTVLEPNMVIAIEAFVGKPAVGASHFEQNLVIRNGAPENLTEACASRWW
jgi:Xaa-Pro aminopeptidase